MLTESSQLLFQGDKDPDSFLYERVGGNIKLSVFVSLVKPQIFDMGDFRTQSTIKKNKQIFPFPRKPRFGYEHGGSS